MTDASRPFSPDPGDDRDTGADATRVIPAGNGNGSGNTGNGNSGAATLITPSVPRPAPQLSASEHAADAGVLPAGTRMAEFEITHLIGQGGFGAVYEAWDHTLERTVAIKEYLPTSLSTRGGDGTVTPLSDKHRETFELGMRSFINEARLLAQFDHPSLLKVYRFWEERGTTYMVMPLYRGKTLRQTLADTPNVDEGWLLRIMDGVTQALAVMHNANCYHRDIAPDNILLLEGSGKPVVLDFGAARRVISDKTQAITVILKPGYAPVEQYAEMPDMAQGAWTDVYALGAVMHVAVCGRPPPPSVARIMSDTYAPLAGNSLLRERYSQRLLETIDHALSVRPEHRPASMAELRAELGLEETTTIAPLRASGSRSIPGPAGARAPATAAKTAARSGARPGTPAAAPAGADAAGSGRRPLLIGAAAVVALGVAGGLWWAMQGRSGAPDAPGTVAQAPAPSAPEAAPPAPPPPPPSPSPSPPSAPARRTALESLQALGATATPGFKVQAAPAKAEVQVGKDKLAFEVRSAREGHVYVFLLASGGELFLLFPNLLDKYNKINAGGTLSLPRASWPMNAGGPPGTNHFAVVVSEHERDFSEAGMQSDGVFPQFPLSVLSALEAAQAGKGPTPLLGKPQCPNGQPCTDVFGAADFKIVER